MKLFIERSFTICFSCIKLWNKINANIVENELLPPKTTPTSGRIVNDSPFYCTPLWTPGQIQINLNEVRFKSESLFSPFGKEIRKSNCALWKHRFQLGNQNGFLCRSERRTGAASKLVADEKKFELSSQETVTSISDQWTGRVWVSPHTLAIAQTKCKHDPKPERMIKARMFCRVFFIRKQRWMRRVPKNDKKTSWKDLLVKIQ